MKESFTWGKSEEKKQVEFFDEEDQLAWELDGYVELMKTW